MPAELRLKEDLERAKASRENKSRGQQAFLQKYWHKGAFYSVRFNLTPPPRLSYMHGLD